MGVTTAAGVGCGSVWGQNCVSLRFGLDFRGELHTAGLLLEILAQGIILSGAGLLGKALLSVGGWRSGDKGSSQWLNVLFVKAWTFKVAFRVRGLDSYMENIFSEGCL